MCVWNERLLVDDMEENIIRCKNMGIYALLPEEIDSLMCQNITLSEIESDTFSDEQIQKIVYSGIEDNGKNAEYAIVFGNSMLLNARVNTAVAEYKKGRVKKIVFTGGKNGISNQNEDPIPEAIKMKKLAMQLGVNEEDIIVEANSNNTFENIDNVFEMLPSHIHCVAIITSEFHLKRCMAIIKNKFPDVETILIASKDGFSDSDNWFLSDNSWNSGRSLATYEAGLLVKYAKKGQIYDLTIGNWK